MTYPPQPPGEPGPYGQQGPHGQQPGGYPAGGPNPTQFQVGGTQQFGQPGYDQFGQPQGYPGGPDGEPPKKKTGLIVGLAIAAMVLIGGVVTLILVLTGGDGEDPQAGTTLPSTSPRSVSSAPSQVPPSSDSEQSDPEQSTAPSSEVSAPDGPAGSPADVEEVRELGEQAIEAISNRDPDLAREVSCDSDSISDEDFESFPEGIVIEMAGDPVITGDSAAIPAAVTHQGETRDFPLMAKRESDRWCISG
jgi:hypothetical protein